MLSVKEDFCRILGVSTSFLYLFRSLMIYTRLVFISYFVSVPLRKVIGNLEYQCSFVPVSFCIF